MKLPSNILLIGIVILSLLLFFFLPDWASVALALLAIFWVLFSTIHHFIMQKISGNLLYRVPNNKSLPRLFVNGVSLTVLGTVLFFNHSNIISPSKLCALSFVLIFSGFFRMVEYFQSTEIRQKGILHETEGFFRWNNIESFVWEVTDNELSLKLRNSYFFKKNVRLTISPVYWQEIVTYLKQYVNSGIESEPPTPFQTKNAG
jgi:hypothetical protein